MDKNSDKLILLTNDDGVTAEGLVTLERRISGIGKIIIVAPSEERSASSHSLTIHHPVRIVPLRENVFSVTGTPADCVVFGLRKILDRLPDLVISGINHGPNLGDDVYYSGTVGAAREAALCGVPSMAVSVLRLSSATLEAAADFVLRFVKELEWGDFPEGTFFNINVPAGCPARFRFTRQGSKRAVSAIEEKEDPRGRPYYWIGQDLSELRVDAESDYHAVREGLVSVTPMHRDQTDYRVLRALQDSAGFSRKTKAGG